MTERKLLTERYIASLRFTAGDERPYDIRDAMTDCPLVLRVGRRSKSWIMTGRINGRATKRTLGVWLPGWVPEDENDLSTRVLSLSQARAKCRAWRAQAKAGKDPSVAERRARRQRIDNTLGSVAEDYFVHVKKRGLASATNIENGMRRDLKPLWRRPIADVTFADLREIIESKRTYAGHHLFAHARTFFEWAILQDDIGLTSSPFDRRRPSQILPAREPRSRVLDDDELRAVWQAACELGYPYGHVVRALMITGQRKSDIAKAKRTELKADVLMIPRERYKSRVPHHVMLSDMARDVFDDCPRFRGPYIFSTTMGNRPISGWSRYKRRLDKLCDVAKFRLHDLRRTARTRLSSLCPPHIAERCVGHAPRDALLKTYDLHQYEEPVRAALQSWADRLKVIVAAS